MMPDMIMPPMAPSRITSIGASTPRPSMIGLSTMSLMLARTL